MHRKHGTYVGKLLMTSLRVKFESVYLKHIFLPKTILCWTPHIQSVMDNQQISVFTSCRTSVVVESVPCPLCCAVVIYTQMLASRCTTICVIGNFEYKFWRPEKKHVLSEKQASSHFPFITDRQACDKLAFMSYKSKYTIHK